MIRSQPLAPYLAAVLAIFVLAHGSVTARSQARPTLEQLHAATAAIREQREAAEDRVEFDIIVNGTELGAAGFHLLRPVSDPYWSRHYGRWQAHFDHRWSDALVRYRDVEIQRRVPVSILPDFLEPVSALVSQDRMFPSSLGTASAVAVSTGTFQVVFDLAPRGIAALQALLRPKTTFPGTNEHADWHYQTIADGSPDTPMQVIVLSDNVAYLPIVVQDVIAAATSAGASVTVADRLPAAEALELASRLNGSLR